MSDEPSAAETWRLIEAALPAIKEAREYLNEITRLQDMVIDLQQQLIGARAEIIDLRSKRAKAAS